LYRSAVCTWTEPGRSLTLASEKVRAVVGKSQLVTCHCRERQLPFITILFFYEFQNHHFSCVAHAGSELQDTSIPTITGGKPGGDLVKQTLDHLVVSKLGNNKANVLAIAQGSSEVSISLVVDTADTEKAVKALHELIVASTRVNW
jgi:hypothetical protein